MRKVTGLCAAVAITKVAAFSSLVLAAETAAADLPAADVAKSDLDKRDGASPPSLEEVTVTGSRLGISGFTSPTPVTVMSADELALRAPTNIPDALNTLPQFRAPASPQASRNGNSGQPVLTAQGNVIDLRGLGPSRTLILVDGERVPPSTSNGYVNVDTIPQGLISRVDTVTGGASAAYGSDAVAGVVNFVLDKKFEGLKASIQAGASASYNDYYNGKVTITGGTSAFDGRLHIEQNLSWDKYQGIPDLNTRPVNDGHPDRVGTGTASNPYRVNPNATYAHATYTGLILDGPLAGSQFAPNGTSLIGFYPGTRTVSGRVNSGGDGGVNQGQAAIPRTGDWQSFSRASFDITDRISVFTQVSLAELTTLAEYVPAQNSGNALAVTIFPDNAFLPADLAARMNGEPFTLGKVNGLEGGAQPLTYTHARSTATNAKIGFEGTFANSWRWDVSYSYGVAKQHILSQDTVLPNNYAAVDAVRAPNGQIVCRVTLTNPTTAPGCVPIDIFGVGNTTQAGWNYITGINTIDIKNKMHIGSVNFSGDLFDNWAGTVKGAVGGEVRKQTLEQPNSTPTPDETGILGIPGGNEGVYFANDNYTGASGSVSTREVYGETNIPLLKDAPFAKSLDLDLAGRFTHYSTSGNVETWKAGLSYQANDVVRLRGTVSRDIAAPTLSQLYGTQSASTVPITDPHTNGNGLIFLIQGGNPALKPEKALTYTGGIVLTPVDNLSLSTDIYRIKISDAISAPATGSFSAFAQSILAQCENSNIDCNLINRPLPRSDTSAANFPTSILLSYINQASQEQSGVDFEASSKFAARTLFVPAAGDVTVRALASYLLTQRQVGGPGQSAQSQLGDGSLGFNRFNGLMTVGYHDGKFLLQVTERFVGSANTQNGVIWAPGQDKDPAAYYTDVAASYHLNDAIETFANVQNLFNRQPPVRPSFGDMGVFTATNRFMYDIIGTQVTLGVRARF